MVVFYSNVRTKENCDKHSLNILIFCFSKIEDDEPTIEDSKSEDWFSSILKNYETFVLHAYAIEESTIDQSEYFKEYLKGDLQVQFISHNSNVTC
jgi:hypothetical protein